METAIPALHFYRVWGETLRFHKIFNEITQPPIILLEESDLTKRLSNNIALLIRWELKDLAQYYIKGEFLTELETARISLSNLIDIVTNKDWRSIPEHKYPIISAWLDLSLAEFNNEERKLMALNETTLSDRHYNQNQLTSFSSIYQRYKDFHTNHPNLKDSDLRDLLTWVPICDDLPWIDDAAKELIEKYSIHIHLDEEKLPIKALAKKLKQLYRTNLEELDESLSKLSRALFKLNSFHAYELTLTSRKIPLKHLYTV